MAIMANYDALLKSAIRCKLAYRDPEEVARLWAFACLTLPDSESVYKVWLYAQLEYVENCPTYISSSDTSDDDCQAYFWSTGSSSDASAATAATAAATTMYLTFRGTSSTQDVITDLNIIQERIRGQKYGKIRIHKGFLDQYRSVSSDIEECIRKVIKKHEQPENVEFKLFIAGHSLGGALAQIATVYLGEAFPCLTITCHTFGSPRVGNKAFAKLISKMASDYVRVANTNDPVPMIPQLSCWSHCPRTCIMIDDECRAETKIKDTPWYWRCCKSLANVDFSAPIKDHACDEYIHRIHILLLHGVGK